MVYNILKRFNTFLKNNEVILEANENSPRNQLIKHLSTNVSDEAAKQDIVKKVDLFFAFKKEGRLSGIKEKEKLDINWWIKNNKTFTDFNQYFDEFFNNPDNVSVDEYYLKYLKGNRLYNYDLVPKRIIDHLKNGEDFDGHPAVNPHTAVPHLTKKGFSIAFENPSWLVVVPHTKWASIFFSKMNEEPSWRYASWCTGKYDKEDHNNYFNRTNYTPHGFQYIIIDKVRRTKYNIQFSNHSSGNKQTEQNNTISQGEYDVFPIELITAMFNFEDKNEAKSLRADNIADFYKILTQKRYSKIDELAQLPFIKQIETRKRLKNLFDTVPINERDDLNTYRTTITDFINKNLNTFFTLDDVKIYLSEMIPVWSDTRLDYTFKLHIHILSLQEFFIETIIQKMDSLNVEQNPNDKLTLSTTITDYIFNVLNKPELFERAKNSAISKGLMLPKSSTFDVFERLTPEQKTEHLINRFKRSKVLEEDVNLYPYESIFAFVKYLNTLESFFISEIVENNDVTEILFRKTINCSSKYKAHIEKNTTEIENDNDILELNANNTETEEEIQLFFQKCLSTDFSNSNGQYSTGIFRIFNAENKQLFLNKCLDNGLSFYSKEILKILSPNTINTILLSATNSKYILNPSYLKNAEFNDILSNYIDMILAKDDLYSLELYVNVNAISQKQLHALIKKRFEHERYTVPTTVYGVLSHENKKAYVKLLMDKLVSYPNEDYPAIHSLWTEALIENVFDEDLFKYYVEKAKINPNIYNDLIITKMPESLRNEYLKIRIDGNVKLRDLENSYITDTLILYYIEKATRDGTKISETIFVKANALNPELTKNYILSRINAGYTLSLVEQDNCSVDVLYTYYKKWIDDKKILAFSEFTKLSNDTLRPLKHRYLKMMFPNIDPMYFADVSDVVKEAILKKYTGANLNIPRNILAITPVTIREKFQDVTFTAISDEEFNGLDINSKKTYITNCIEKHILVTPHQLSKLSTGLQKKYIESNAGRFALSNNHFNVLSEENRLLYIHTWLEKGKNSLITPGQLSWARAHVNK